MSLERLDESLIQDLTLLEKEGRAKPPERIIEQFIPAEGKWGPRYRLKGQNIPFLRMNSNSYLSLSNHPELIKAADAATHALGVGPGAVRFIDGTFTEHITLEEKIAQFVNKPAAKIFNSAYTSNCGLALAISNQKTHWVGDQLNHNSIIRAMRIAGVPKGNKSIFNHNDMEDLRKCLKEIPTDIERVIIIFDGVYSMRGDIAPIDRIIQLAKEFDGQFKDGIVTVVDDSHGIGAFGNTGRGTPEYCKASPDIIIGTFGKAFGVNGGFIAASHGVIEAVRQKADTYIYTNPLSMADCAAASKALDICNSSEGELLLKNLSERQQQLRGGFEKMGKESIDGPHPVIPLLVRDTNKTRLLVQNLFHQGILAVGLTFPVVPRGDESIRFQINAAHTEADIDMLLSCLRKME